MIAAAPGFEGAGFPVWRGFAGLPLAALDPFVLLDQAGPVVWAPDEAKGAPWHPHRGFETVTYLLDGEIRHRDSNGGGGVIGPGDTQWMTAGSGVLHDEVPTEESFRRGGPSHGVQLWVNLRAQDKTVGPRYQTITSDRLLGLRSSDGGAYIRLIAGSLGGSEAGPGVTYSPITFAHATLEPGARLVAPWDPDANAIVYVLSGDVHVGAGGRPLTAHHTALLGPGDHVVVTAAPRQREGAAAEVLLLGGRPLGEPVVHHGPFVMNTEAEIRQAWADYEAGRLGRVPATEVRPV